MNKSTSSKTGLFLMELIISILFFAVSGTICVQLFVESHLTSKKSVELNHAVEWCQNVAEAFYGCDGDHEEMMKLFHNSYIGNAAEAGTTFYLGFDKDFRPVPEKENLSDELPSENTYKLSVNIYEKDRLLTCDITAYSQGLDGTTIDIYTLTVQLPAVKEVSHE